MFLTIFPLSNHLTYIRADMDVVFERDRSLYGKDSLDYIIAIPNHALQALAVYLRSLVSERSALLFLEALISPTIIASFPSSAQLVRDTDMDPCDIRAARAIYKRLRDEPYTIAEAIQGRSRYPGEAVKQAFVVDEY
jgi:hypothetical protein